MNKHQLTFLLLLLQLPTIIQALGGYTPNEVQLWSVIPYAVAAVCTVIVAIISDRMKLRGVIMLFTLPLAIIGYAVIANIDKSHAKVKYGMTMLMATGMYASVPCVLGKQNTPTTRKWSFQI